jgi:hypothetical protein
MTLITESLRVITAILGDISGYKFELSIFESELVQEVVNWLCGLKEPVLSPHDY